MGARGAWHRPVVAGGELPASSRLGGLSWQARQRDQAGGTQEGRRRGEEWGGMCTLGEGREHGQGRVGRPRSVVPVSHTEGSAWRGLT